jgi:hypothetical protein
MCLDARLEALKGHVSALQALARLREPPGWTSWIVGDRSGPPTGAPSARSPVRRTRAASALAPLITEASARARFAQAARQRANRLCFAPGQMRRIHEALLWVVRPVAAAVAGPPCRS